MWPVINLSALIGTFFFFKKKTLQDLLSSLNAVISTNEKNWILTGHVIFKLRYNQIYQLKTTMDGTKYLMSIMDNFWQRLWYLLSARYFWSRAVASKFDNRYTVSTVSFSKHERKVGKYRNSKVAEV